MSILPINMSYEDKDFDSLRQRLFDLIRSVYPDWSVTAVANFGNILVESFAFVGDVLTFYQDQQARESRWGTVQLRRSAISLAKLIGYTLQTATAARGDVTLTLTNPSALTGTVGPVGGSTVTVRTNQITNPVRGELDAPVTFNVTGGEVSKTFTWRHQTTAINYVVASTGREDQILRLPEAPFLWTSEVVSTTVDGTFTRVDSFVDAGPTDLYYRLDIDQNDAAAVIFGDGRNGAIPRGNITVTYKTGGGLVGNLDPNGLQILETEFADTAGTRAFVTVSNPAGTSGGFPREEVAAARYNAPQSLRVTNRTVSREDYEINARRVAGVGRALMLTRNEYSGIGENRGELYVLPISGGVPAQAMLDDVLTMCTVTYPNTTTFQLTTKPVAYKTINVQAMIWLRAGFVPSAVKAAIQTALAAFFAPMLADGTENPAVDFGWNYKDEDGEPAGSIAWSDIFNVIRDVAGVRKVDQSMLLNSAVTDVAISNFEFPALGSITLLDGITGTAI